MNLRKAKSLNNSRKRRLSRELRIRDIFAPAALSIGMLMAPWTYGMAQAEAVITNIERQDNGAIDNLGNGVYKIYAGQIASNAAVNRFKTFNLQDGHIANMMFNTKENIQANQADPANLINFVNDRIQVYGTINAIKNKGIGGNIYFLSPNGMVVGANGAINAGSFTVMAGGAHPGSDVSDTTIASVLNKTYALNTGGSGTDITIFGKINAPDGVYAITNTDIVVGNKSNAAAINTQYNNASNDAVDFSTLVKLDADQRTQVGLTNDGLVLRRTAGANGDVMLLASAMSPNTREGVGSLEGAVKDTSKATITINKNAEIKSFGTVDIKAEASNVVPFGNFGTFGSAGGAIAEVTIDGNITAGNQLLVGANATYDYEAGTWENMANNAKEAVIDDLQALVGKEFISANLGLVGSSAEAKINIGQNAKLTANGSDSYKTEDDGTQTLVNRALSIKANATNVATSDTVKAESGTQGEQTKRTAFAAIGVLYQHSKTESKINIGQGAELKATKAATGSEKAGGVALASTAITKSSGETLIKKSAAAHGADKSGIGIMIAKSKTDNEIAVGNGVKIEGNSTVDVKASTSSSSGFKATVKDNDSTDINTALVYAEMDSKAKVAINGNLTATAGAVNISALEESKVNVKANNSETPTTLDPITSYMEAGPGILTSMGINMLFNTFKKNAVEDNPEWDEKKIPNSMFTAGAAVAIAKGKSEGTINIANTSQISGYNGINMDAQSLLKGMTLGATSAVIANNDNGIGVSAGILVSKLENEATINIEGNSVASNAAKLNSDNGDIKLNTLTKYEWNRTKDMLKAVKDNWKAFVALAGEEDQKLKTALEDLPEDDEPTSEQLSLVAKKFSQADLGAVFMKYSQAAPQKVAALAKLITSMEAFLNAASYVDVNVGAVAKGALKIQKAEVAGAVAVTEFVKKSEIKIGENVTLNAKNNIEMLSKTVQKDVDFYGNFAGTVQTFNKAQTGYGKAIMLTGVNPSFIPNMSDGGDTVVGGNIGVDKNTTKSLVQIDNGVELTGNNIKLDTENDVKHVAFALGGGKASAYGVSGMVAVSSGESKSIVQVDNSAKITAKAAAPGENDAYNVALKARNDTNVFVLAGDYTSGDKAGIGVSIGVASFDVITRAEIGNFITAATAVGYIDANSIKVNAFTDGTINTITIAGAAAGGHTETDAEKEQKVRDNQKGGDEKKALKDIAINAKGQHAAADDMGESLNLLFAEDKDGNAMPEAKNDAENNANNNSTVALAGAGSISWNSVVNETIAGINGINIGKGSSTESTADDANAAKLHITAEDDSYIGAYSGAMALTLMGKNDHADFNGTLAGAVAVNDLKKSTKAHVNAEASSKATINTSDLYNKAVNQGQQVAEGLSLGIQRKEGAGVNIAASASINLINSKVEAEIQNNNINNKTIGGSVSNIANDKDLQVAGGVTAQYTKSSLGVGAAITVNRIFNTANALMAGNNIGSAGNYLANVDNMAVTKLTQIGTAVSVGISTNEKNIGVFNGAVAANVIGNDASAIVNNSNIYAGTVASEAKDGKLGSDSETYTARVTELKSYGLDVDGAEAKVTANNNGQGYKDSSLNGELNTTGAENNKSINYTAQKAKVDNSGNLIVGLSAAVAVATKSNAGIGAGVVYNKVDNDFTARYSGGSINTNKAVIAENDAPNVKISAEADTLMVGVAAGVAAQKTKPGASVAGSVVVQNIDNDTLATLENVDIQANKVQVTADNRSNLTSVAGMASISLGGNGAAVGLTWAQNDLANTTGAYVNGLKLAGNRAEGNAYNPNLDASADNTSTAWAVGLGAAVGQGSNYNAALIGAYASNNGDNNTEAVVDKYNSKRSSVTKAGNVSALAKDNTKLKSLAGEVAVNVAGEASVALGGAVATNNVGSSSNRQQIKAQINNTDIEAVEGTEVAVNATNASDLLSVAVGGAVAADTSRFDVAVSAQGSVAVSNVYTNTDASMSNSNVNGYGASVSVQHDNNDEAEVRVQADNTTNVVNTADGLAVGAGIGMINLGAVIGVAKTKSYADTYAGITGESDTNRDQYRVKNLTVKATATNKVTDVGFSASVGVTPEGLGAAIIANISNNTIQNNTTAEIKNVYAAALENVAVQASSQEVLKNYSGSLNVGIAVEGSTLGIGATVANNDILGSTSALIMNSDITALGSDYAAGSNTGIAVDQFTLNTDQSNDDYGTTAKKYVDEGKTQKPVKRGLVVTADAYHDMTNVSVTAGVGGGSFAGIAIDTTIATNTIGGDDAITKALITNTAINDNVSNNDLQKANVYVAANDLTDASNHVGTLGVTAEGQAGLSLAAAVENNSLTRGVEAAIINDTNTKKKLHGYDVDVVALNASKLLASVSGMGVAGGAMAGIAGIGVASIDRFTNRTLSEIKGMDVLAHNLTIDAEKINKTNKYTNGASFTGGYVAGAAGVSVALLDDTSSTDAKLLKTNVQTIADESDVVVQAHHNSNVSDEVGTTDIAIGLGGAAGITVGVNDIKNTVSAEVSESKIGTATADVHDITIEAANNLKANITNYVIGGGLVGIGVGVGVNTINTGTAVKVKNSELYAAGDIRLKAEEQRKLIEHADGATIGGVDIGTNVMINNIGTALADDIDYENGNGETDKGGNKYSTAKIKNFVNNAIDKQNDALKNIDKDSGLKTWSAGAKSAPGVQTVVEGTSANKTKLLAGNNISISNLAHNDINTNVTSGTFGIIGVNVSVGNTSVKDELGVNINNAAITAKNIDVTSLIDGTLENTAQQASGSVAEVNVGVSKATHSGSNQINIAGSSFTALGKDLNTTSNNDYKVTITAGNDSVVKNNALAASVAGVHGGGLHGVAKDAVDVGINIGAGTMNSDGSIKATTAGSANTLLGSGNVAIKAYSNPEVYSKAQAASISVLTGAGTIADAYAEGSAKLNVFAGNTFDTKALSLNAYTGVDSDNTNDTAKTTTTKADVIGTFISGGSVVVNKARTHNNMQAITNVETATYQNTVVSTNTLKYVPVMENGKQAYTTKADGVVYTSSGKVDPETGELKYNITAGAEKFYKYYVLDEGGRYTYKTKNDDQYNNGKTLTYRNGSGITEGYYYHKKDEAGEYIRDSQGQLAWELYTGPKEFVVIEMSENAGVYEQVGQYAGTAQNPGTVENYGRKLSNTPVFGAGKNVYLYNDMPVLEQVSQVTSKGATNVAIGATNATSSEADIKGVNIGIGIASGSNYAETSANNTVLVNLNAGEAHVNNMTIRASNADSIDSYADGNGGGIVDISPMAAAIKNNISATTTANVSGSVTAEGKLDIDALRTNNVLLQTNTFSINLVGGSGDHVDNSIKDVVTTVNVKNANLKGQGLIVKAENVSRINPPDTSAADIDDQKFYNMMMTSAYGGLSVDCGYVDNLVDTTAAVNVDNTQLLSSKGIEINAHTDNLMNAHAYASGGGVIAGGKITVDNDIISKDTVNISGSNTSIKNTATDKDLVITAADEQQFNSYSFAETTGGIFGATISKLNNDVNREAKINVNAGSLYSNKDINYYAGKVADGNLALAVMNLEARDYAGALIDFVLKPSMDNDFEQKNSVVIGSGVSSYSMKDTNLYASVGRQLVSEKVAAAGLIGESVLKNSVVSTERGSLSRNLHTDNFIEINGKAIAGIASRIDVYIGGGNNLPAVTSNTTSRGTNNGVEQLVVAEEYLQGAKDYKTNVDKNADAEGRKYEVVGVDGVYVRLDKDPAVDLSLNDFKFGTEDYANALLNRYNALKKLMDEYERDDVDAYTGYLLERERIANILEQENLATITRVDGRITKIVINERINVGYVEVPYLSGSGGNINAYTDVFKGTGTIEAKGAPQINILNNTNLELKLNGIYVGEAGGIITYNGNEIPVGEASDTAAKKTIAINKAITGMNKNQEAAGFATAWAETEPVGGTINVQDVYKQGNIKVTDPNTHDTYISKNIGYLTVDNYNLVDGKYVLKSGLTNYTTDYVAVKPDIYVQANVHNISGNVSIYNDQGSIYIQGKNVDDSVGISGDSISLNAPHGSIYQGYSDGIINIGASPQDQYNYMFLDSKANEQSLNAGNIEIELNEGAAPTGSWIAGNSVYINAADINVNGVIQSGFGDYYAQIDAKTQANIDKVSQNYDGKTQLTDKQVVRGTAYRVIEGGPVWNDDKGCYVYKMSVYYNPSTKKLILEDVDNSGGRIYLSGRISSTNTSGNIICLDGVSDVTINNMLNYDLAVGRVNINEVNGLIRITDTAYAGTYKDKDDKDVECLAKVSEYTKNGAKYWYLAKNNPDFDGSKTSTSDIEVASVYDVKSNLYYRWTQGFNFSEIKYYEKDIKTGGWSIEWSSEETKNNLPGYSTNPIKIDDDGETSRPNGEYVGFANTTSGSSQTYPFNISFTKVPTSEMVYTLDYEDTWKSGFLGYYHHNYKKWHTTQGVRTTFVSTLKADNDINIKFIGSTADNGSISVSSTKNIELNGSMGNSKLYAQTVEGNTALNEKGSIYVATTGGSIVQNGGNIYGADVTLSAAKNIEHINIKAGDNLNLNAVNTVSNVNQIKDATNKIDITVGANGNALANVSTGYLGSVLENTSSTAATYSSLMDTTKPTGNTGLINLTVNGGMRKLEEAGITIKGGNITQAAKLNTGYNKLSYSDNKLVKTHITLNNKTGDTPLTAAERISLTTSNGSIYGHSIDGGVAPYVVYGGQYAKGADTLSASISAAAEGNINLSQAKGNMRIGKIYSNKGDVYLYARDGSVDDALPYIESDMDTQSQLIKRWMDLGMIEPEEGFTPDEKITKAKHVKETVEKNFSLNADFVNNTYPTYRAYLKEITELEAIPEEQRTDAQKADLVRDKQFVSDHGQLCQYFENNYYGYIHDDGSVDSNYLKDYQSTYKGYVSSDGQLDLAAYLQHTLLNDYTNNIKAQYAYLAKLKAISKRTAEQEEQYQYLMKTYGDYADADSFMAHNTDSLRYTKRIEADALAVATYQYWNKDALLYSLQNSIINVNPDDRPTTSLKDPNIVGHNINIEVKDAAGFYAVKVDENTKKPILDEHGEYIIDTKEINVSTLLDRNESGYINPNAIDDLKLLSQADASTVTWEYRDNAGNKYSKEQFESNRKLLDSDPEKKEIDRYAIVTKRMPIGIQQSEDASGKLGALTVTSAATSADTNASGSIFLEGRDQKAYESSGEPAGTVITINPITENKDLNLNRIESNIGSIYISSLGNILNNDAFYGTASQIINVMGKDIYLLAGGYNYADPKANSIGTINRPITTKVLYDASKPGSGWLAAVAGGGVYIDNIGGSDTPLKLRNISSGNDIDIRSDGDIIMQELHNMDATNYLFTTNDGYITIISRYGSIGALKGENATIDPDTGLEMAGLRLKNHAMDQNPYVQYDDVYTDDNGEHSYTWKTDAEKAAIDGKVTWNTTYDKDGVPVIKGTYTENGVMHTVTKHDKSLVTLGAKDGVYVEGITTKVDVGLTDPEGKLNLRIINENKYHNTANPAANMTNVGIRVNGDLNLLNDVDVANIASVYSEKEIIWDKAVKLHSDSKLFLGSATNLMLYNGELSAGTLDHNGIARLRAGNDINFGTPTPDAQKNMNLLVYGTLEMEVGRDILLNSDQTNSSNVSLIAERNILQKYINTDDSAASAAQSHSLSAEQLHAAAGGQIDLGSRFNQLVDVSIDSKADAGHIGEDVVIIGNGNSSRTYDNGNARTLNVVLQETAKTAVNGNVVIHNYANGTTDADKNDISLTMSNNLTIANSLILTNDEDNVAIKQPDGSASGPKTLTIGDNLTIMAENNAFVYRFGSVVAGKNIDIDAKNDIHNFAVLTAQQGGITMDAGSTIQNVGNQISAEDKITLTADNGLVWNLGFIKAKEHIGLVSKKGNVLNTIPDNPEDAGTYGILSENGSVTIWSASDYMNKDITGSYQGLVRNISSIKAKKNISLISYNGNVENKGAIESLDSAVTIAAYVDDRYTGSAHLGNVINVDNNIDELHNIRAKSIEIGAAYDVINNGDMVVVGAEGETGNITITAGSTRYGFKGVKNYITDDGQLQGFGEIDNSGSFTILNNGTITLIANDDILNTGSMLTDGVGDIRLTTVNGSIYNAAEGDMLAADGDVTLNARGAADSYYINYTGDIVELKADVEANKAILATKHVGQCVIIDNRLYASDGTGKYYNAKGDLEDIPQKGVSKIQADIITVDGKNRVLYTGGTIINEGDLTALKDTTASNKGNITIYSEHGSIYNRDDFNIFKALTHYKGKDISTGNIYIIAPEGYIYNDKNLYSQDDVYIAAKEGLDNFSYDIYAEKDVMLLGTGGVAENLQFGSMTIFFNSGEAVDANVVNKSKILSNSGNVTLQSYNGSVSNLDGGDIAAFKGNIILEAAKTVDKDSKKLQFIASDGSKGYLGAAGTIVTDKQDAVEVDSYVRTREAAADGKYKTVVRYKVNDIEYTYDFADKGDVAVYREGSVVNYGDLLAGSYEVNGTTINSDKKNSGSITLKSATADVYNYDDFNKITPDSSVIGEKAELIYDSDKFGSYAVATGDLLFSAVNGLIYNSKKELVAEGNVTLEAKDALTSFGNDIYAGGNINLIATEGNLVNKAELVSITGDIKLTAKEGTVVNLLGADMLALNGDIILTAGALPDKDENDYSKIQYVDNIGNVGHIDVVNSDDKKNISSKTLLTDLYYIDDETGKYTFFSGDPKELSDGYLGGLTATEKATLVSVVKYIDEVKDPETGRTQFVKICLGGDDHPINVYEPGSTTATKTLLAFTAVDQEGHEATMYGIEANLEAFRIGDVVNRGDAVALKAPVHGAGPQGIVLSSEHGNVTNYDNYSYLDGKTKNVNDSIIYKYTGKTSAGELIFNDHVMLSSGVDPKVMKDYVVGHVDAERNILVAKSSIGLVAPEGYFYSATNISTENNLDLVGKNDIIIGDNIVAIVVGGDLTATSTQGKVGVTDTDLFVGGDVNFIAKTGIVNTKFTKGSITSVNGSINLVTENGDILNNNTDLSAYKRVDAYTDAGNIDITGNISSGSYTDSKGEIKINPENNLTHIWTGNGEIKAENASITSTGSIDIGSKNGNVAVGSMKAETIAAAGSLSGDVTVGTITADKIILASNDDNGHVAADHISVGTGLVIQADYANIPDIQRLPDSTGMLLMDISGAHGDVMKGEVKITTPGDTRYNTLAVTNAEINVIDGGRLGVQRMKVAEEAHLTAFDFRTAVYGVINENIGRDQSPALYFDLGKGKGSVENLGLERFFEGRDIKIDPEKGVYDTQFIIDGIDTKINTLSTGADNWQDGDNDGWMNLFIDNPRNQRSNGLLLHMDKYHYGHYQRYAADSLSRILANTKALDTYELDVMPVVPMYLKYDLVNDGSGIDDEKQFFNITNVNNILGFALTNEDLQGVSKFTLDYDGLNNNTDTEERKNKAKRLKN